MPPRDLHSVKCLTSPVLIQLPSQKRRKSTTLKELQRATEKVRKKISTVKQNTDTLIIRGDNCTVCWVRPPPLPQASQVVNLELSRGDWLPSWKDNLLLWRRSRYFLLKNHVIPGAPNGKNDGSIHFNWSSVCTHGGCFGLHSRIRDKVAAG